MKIRNAVVAPSMRQSQAAAPANDEVSLRLPTMTPKSLAHSSSSSHYYYCSFRRSAGQDARDLAIYRTWLKIQVLDAHFETEKQNANDRDKNNFIRRCEGRLMQRGWTNRDIGHVGSDMEQSIRFEMKGDSLRSAGRCDEAMQHYAKALKVPIFSCGRKDNPDVAFLWRKLGCLAAIRRQQCEMSSVIPRQFRLDMMDVVSKDQTWTADFKDFLFTPALECVTRGDTFYQECKYDRAAFEYRRAVIIGNLCQVKHTTNR
jgi:hypothetical protein